MFSTEFSRKVSLSIDDSHGRIQDLRHLDVCLAWCELFAVWEHRCVNESGIEGGERFCPRYHLANAQRSIRVHLLYFLDRYRMYSY
jgi:hypothetical protein